MPDSTDGIQFAADRGDARLRLDRVLVRRLVDVSHLSRSLAQQWIEAGAVRIDGRVTRRAAARLREGAIVEVTLPTSAVRRAVPQAEPLDLHVLYEDESVLVLDKQAGVVVHPSYKQTSGTLINAVLWRYRERTSFRPGILTRLDKDTSGIVVIALAPAVHARLQRDTGAGSVRKEYLALVGGDPQPRSGTIIAPLGRDPDDRRRIIVTPGGAYSETRYDVIDAACPDGISLVRCELVTGRTHQIRVHLASRGWPILGDRIYGRADAPIARQALHAWRLTLPHPVTGETLRLVAPLPDDMRAAGGEGLHQIADGGAL